MPRDGDPDIGGRDLCRVKSEFLGLDASAFLRGIAEEERLEELRYFSQADRKDMTNNAKSPISHTSSGLSHKAKSPMSRIGLSKSDIWTIEYNLNLNSSRFALFE